MRGGLLHVDLGAADPDHHETVAAVLRLERTDVGNQLLGEVPLVLALLDVRAVEALDVPLVEHRRHRLDGLELGANLIELGLLEHAGRPRGRVAVLFEDVPAAEDDVVEAGERHEVLDLRGARLGALAKPDRPHLGQRADRLRQPFPDRHHAGNGGRADGAQADQQHAELAARGGDLNWWSHNRPLYHGEMRRFLRKSSVGGEPLAVTMSGVRLGERALQIGIDDPHRGRDRSQNRPHRPGDHRRRRRNGRGMRARRGRRRRSARRRPRRPADPLPFADGAYDVIVLHAVGGLLSSPAPDVRERMLAECRRVLRVGGRSSRSRPVRRPDCAVCSAAPEPDARYRRRGERRRAGGRRLSGRSDPGRPRGLPFHRGAEGIGSQMGSDPGDRDPSDRRRGRPDRRDCGSGLNTADVARQGICLDLHYARCLLWLTSLRPKRSHELRVSPRRGPAVVVSGAVRPLPGTASSTPAKPSAPGLRHEGGSLPDDTPQRDGGYLRYRRACPVRGAPRGLPTLASSLVHGVFVVTILWVTSGAPETAPVERTEPRLVFLARPGPGGGGGGGGLRNPLPPRAAETRSAFRRPRPAPDASPNKAPIGARHLEVRTPTPAPFTTPTPVVQDPLPSRRIVAPVAAVANGNQRDRRDRAGAQRDHQPGSRRGGGTGTGRGAGDGEGMGAGIGPGSGGGIGGGPIAREAASSLRVCFERSRRVHGRGSPARRHRERPPRNRHQPRRHRRRSLVRRGLGAGLDQRAIDAVRQWKFAPARRLGAPVDVIVEVAVELVLR